MSLVTQNSTVECLLLWIRIFVFRSPPKREMPHITVESHKSDLCVTIFVSALECRDIELALYDCIYVFNVLCSIFQYFIKWLHSYMIPIGLFLLQECLVILVYTSGNF